MSGPPLRSSRGAPLSRRSFLAGNDRLPRELARRLGSRVEYGARLLAVERRGDGLRLAIERLGRRQTLRAPRLVLALPLPALREVSFDPPLPEELRRMIREVPYTAVAKTHVQARWKFWRQRAAVELGYSDSPFERFFDVSPDPEADRGMLTVWINGSGLARFRGHSEAAHSAAVVAFLQRLFPAGADAIETAVTTDWSKAYSAGAYMHLAPGLVGRFGPLLGRSEGGILFAGAHTQIHLPGLEAAVVSGRKAAEEILGGKGC